MPDLPERADALEHDWAIAPREYARQESRRGRRHAYASLVPVRTALVVVDVVPFFVDENPYCRGILANVALLADRLRAAGGTVAWVVPGTPPPSRWAEEFYGPEVAELFRTAGGSGTVRERLWPGFDVYPDDLQVEKTATSAFFPGRRDLPDLLADRGIDTVLVTGTVTNVCCESTARDASTRGYRVLMVADANAAPDDRAHNATLHTIYRTFGDVRPTDEVLALLAEGRPGLGSCGGAG